MDTEENRHIAACLTVGQWIADLDGLTEGRKIKLGMGFKTEYCGGGFYARSACCELYDCNDCPVTKACDNEVETDRRKALRVFQYHAARVGN